LKKAPTQTPTPAGNSTTPPAPAGSRSFFLTLFCLVIVLSVLFHGSFESGRVVFSNDGPLGAAVAQTDRGFYNLRGFWQELNWIGIEQPGGILALGYVLFAALGPILVAKFIAPISLLILGMSAWLMFRQWRFGPVVCLLGALAAALNMQAFSVSAWGLYAWALSRAGLFLALAALPVRTTPHPWLRTMLAGFAVGMVVTDGFDLGAILSLVLAAFVLFLAMISSGPPWKRMVKGLAQLAVVVACSALFAADGLTALIGTQIKGVVGMQQDKGTREQRWAQATASSVPKKEALRVIIPGLFGYRMPELYGQPLDSVGGGNYWGAVGRVEGTNQFRHSGSGEFAGVLVTVVALWAVIQSFRRKRNLYSDWERKFIWFWGGAGIVSLLLAFGKHAPFYQLVYALPYFSTIRNPFKFLHPLQVSLVILFAFGLQGLYRHYILSPAQPLRSAVLQFKKWWPGAPGFDRRWTMGAAMAVGLSLVVWLMYSGTRASLVRHLQATGFPDAKLADSIAGFSLMEVGWFIAFLSLSLAMVALIQCGYFSGKRARWAGFGLGLLLVTDLARADLPWIVYLDYPSKYQSNPIIEELRRNPPERRVTGELFPLSRAWLVNEQNSYFALLYFEWLQHHFQYFRIQSLDVNQMSRVSELDRTFMTAFEPVNGTGRERRIDPGRFQLCGRLWQLTNTRFVLGVSGFLELLNKQVDPGHERFKVHTAFNVVPKAGIPPGTRPEELTPEQLTAVPDPQGQFALFEFTGALPRARLFNHWVVSTNDDAVLARLADPAFDPAQTVLVADPLPDAATMAGTNQASGKVEIVEYQSKHVRLNAETGTPAVLLLNDRFNPGWRVTVDGQPAPMLRCNFIMRGVYLTPGRHEVLFRFQPPATAFYVSLFTWLTAVVLCAFVVFSSRRSPARPEGENEGGRETASDSGKPK